MSINLKAGILTVIVLTTLLTIFLLCYNFPVVFKGLAIALLIVASVGITFVTIKDLLIR